MQQKLNRSMHTKDVEMFFQTVEPFIDQIKMSEQGKLHPEIKKQLAYYLDITTKEHRSRLTDKFPKSVAYATNSEQDLPEHVDHWVEAKVGDVVRKTGTRYVSNVENGNYYVVLKANHDHVVVFDNDGQIKTLCFPEEYEVVGNIDVMINERDEAIRLRSRETNIRIWKENGLSSFEREAVDKWLEHNKSDSVLEHFTEHWKTYYDLGIEREAKGLDIMSQLLGRKATDET